MFPESFDLQAVAAVWGIEADQALDALWELMDYSLVEYGTEAKRYKLHDLARKFAQEKLDADTAERETLRFKHAQYFKELLAQANELYLKGGDSIRDGLRWYDLEKLNIHTGQKWSADNRKNGDDIARLCCEYPGVGVYILDLRLHARELIDWQEAGLDSARLLKDRKVEGVHLGNLGLAYAHLGETRKAIEYLEQQLIITREIGDRRGEGNALWNMSLALEKLGEHKQAIALARKALAIREQIEDPNAERVRRKLAEWEGESH